MFALLIPLLSAQLTGTQVPVRQVVPRYQIWTLDLAGPATSESADPNPFRDYRVTVDLEAPSGTQYAVPGFYAGDGAGGGNGNLWQVRFFPDEEGPWTWSVRFEAGSDIAATTLGAGAPVAPSHGTGGSFQVAGTSPQAEGFFERGRLRYVGAHYLRFSDGSRFLPTGTGSPENLLAFAGFDNTIDQGGGLPTPGLTDGVHRYPNHIPDAPADAPAWTGDQGINSRGITGAIQYLSDAGLNSVYVLLNNVDGDGREVYPWVNWFERDRYDLSKLHQWWLCLEFAQRRGLMLNLFFFEKENFHVLDQPSRRIFFREMIARFGSLPAIKWTIQEESDLDPADLTTIATTIRALDPYDKPLGFHTNKIDDGVDYEPYEAVLGSDLFDITSIQCTPELVSDLVEHWRTVSAAAGRPWVVDIDEVTPGLSEANDDIQRKDRLWDALLSGGGYAAYCGEYDLPVGGDLTIEDFRSRENAWFDLRVAHDFIADLNFWALEPADEYISGESTAFGGAEGAFDLAGQVVVYFPDASNTGMLDMSGMGGSWVSKWFDPRNAVWHQGDAIDSGGLHEVGPPPNSPNEDWVLLLDLL